MEEDIVIVPDTDVDILGVFVLESEEELEVESEELVEGLLDTL